MRRRLRVALMVFLLAAPGSATAQGSPSGEGLPVREHAEPSGLQVLILSDRWQGGGRSLWIDPESRHVVRYVEDRLVPSPPGTLPRSELVSVEYHDDDVELNPRLSASAVWVWLPLSLVYGKILRETALQVAALVVPVGVMFVLACRYGRRERPSGRAIAVRAGLWSLAICWSVGPTAATGCYRRRPGCSWPGES